MQVFSEKVNHTSTNGFLNILQTESFEEIFYDVFEVQINGNKYPLEKISEYKGSPVVSVPVLVEDQEVFFPFVLVKGKQEIIFNENNTLDTLSLDGDVDLIKEKIIVPVVEETKEVVIIEQTPTIQYQNDKRSEILEEIAQSKKEALEYANFVKDEKIKEANKVIKRDNKLLEKTLDDARSGLVEDFLNISKKIKDDLFDFSNDSESKLSEKIDNRISIISEDLKRSLSNNFDESSKHFDKNVKEVIKELYKSIVIPKVDSELKSISTDIVEKVSEIETELYNKLDETLASKADKTLIESINEEVQNIQKLNVELNDNINKGLSKALSRVGKVSKEFETFSEEIDKKIDQSAQEISDYYTQRVELLETQAFDLNDKTRQYFIGLIEESRDNLIEEIRRTKEESPVEYLVEAMGKKDPEVVSIDKLKKEYDKIIHDKFENYKVDLRKYITVYGGGGSGTVAMQFADGGTMNGDLNVTSRILSGGVDLATLFSGGGGGATGAYLPLSGGTMTGSVTANSFVTLNGLSSQFVKGDGSLDDTQYLTSESLNSNVILYPTTAVSDLSATYKLVASLTDPDYDQPAVDISTGSINADEKLVGTLASAAGIIVGHPGVINVTVLGNIRKTAGSSSSSATFHFHVYKRSSSGTLTLIGISDNTLPSTNAVYAQFSTSLVANFGDWVATDRIVVEFYAQRVVGGGNPTYDFEYGGETPVRILLPLPTNVLLSEYVPYTGATTNLNLGSNAMIATNILVYNDIDASTGNIYGKFSRLQPVGYSSNIALEVDDIDANTRFTVTGNGDVSTQGNIESAGLIAGNSLSVGGDSAFGVDTTFTYSGPSALTHRTALGLGTGNSPTFNSVGSGNLVYRGGNTNAAALTIGTNDAYALNFETNGVTRMSILSSGNVGIGTITPTAKLEITDTTLAGGAGLSGSALIVNQTWNTNLTPTAFSVKVTDLSSNASSLLMDLQVGGSSKFKVDKNGLITTTNGLMSNSILYLGSYNNQYAAGLYSNGDLRASIIRAGLGNNSPSFTADANDIMAQRNGLTSQTFNLYNTYTSATSAERATFKFVNNDFVIGAETLPLSGPQRSMLFQTGSATRMSILSSGNVGIGTTTSPEKLTVVGNISATGNIFSNFLSPNTSFTPQYIGGTSVSTAALKVQQGSGGYARISDVESFQWSSTGNLDNAADLSLSRDLANTLAQRNGLNAQEFRLYNTYTSATSAERATFKFVNNDFVIGAETLPLSGPQRSMLFQTNSATRMSLLSTGEVNFSGNGNLTMPYTKKVLATGGPMFIGSNEGYSVNIVGGSAGNWYSGIFTNNSTNDNRLYVGGGIGFGLLNSGSLANNDVSLIRSLSGTLDQRSGTTSQTFNLYNTYTSATSAERATFKFDSNNNFVIGAETLPLSGPQRSMLFQTNNATRMTILSSGNVGIGVANPTGKLVIDAPNSITNRNLVFEQSTGSSAQVNEIVWRSSSGSIFDYAKIKTSYGTSYLNSYFTIQVASSAQVLQDRFHINTVGNVGIGTILPSEALTVVGNISATGAVTAGGATYSSVIGYNATVGGYFQCGANSTLVGLCSPNTDNLTPIINGVTSNNTVDLGKSATRFRKLYVGGVDLTGDSTYGAAATFTYNAAAVTTHRNALGLGVAQTPTFGGLSSTGDIEITDSTKGIILKSPNGARWRITINDAGLLTPTSI